VVVEDEDTEEVKETTEVCDAHGVVEARRPSLTLESSESAPKAVYICWIRLLTTASRSSLEGRKSPLFVVAQDGDGDGETPRSAASCWRWEAPQIERRRPESTQSRVTTRLSQKHPRAKQALASSMSPPTPPRSGEANPSGRCRH
jgi:hypothetical protein